MSLEGAVESVVLLGGSLYVLDKVTGKRKKLIPKHEINRRAKQVKRKVTPKRRRTARRKK